MKNGTKEALDSLLEQAADRRLHWESVIKAARKKTSPLNAEFTWNKNEGFLLNLRAEAQALIREYTIVITTTDQKVIRTRKFLSLSSDRKSGGGYRAVHDVLSDEVLAERMLEDALSEAQSFMARYQKLQQLAPVFKAIEKVIESRTSKRGRKGESVSAAA